MVVYEDNKRRANAVHVGEAPQLHIDTGPANIHVTLDTWGPQDDFFTTLYDVVNATSGEEPSRSANQECHCQQEGRVRHGYHLTWEHRMGWCRLSPTQRQHVEDVFAGKTLQQALEKLTFSFCVDGVTRAFTHEFVRTRVGAAFMQHGGRDNDWRHRHWTMPEAMERMCQSHSAQLSASSGGEFKEVPYPMSIKGRAVCIENWEPIERVSKEFSAHELTPAVGTIREAITAYLEMGKRLYAALVDAGIAWQDARRLLPIGTQTYIHGEYNYLGLRGMLANRLEHVMDWEMNCVAQLMLRQIKIHCPPIISRYLGSHSDIASKAMFDRLELFPPDGKYPATTIRCRYCKHAEANHHKQEDVLHPIPDEMFCEVCARDGGYAPLHRFTPEDILPRIHRRSQAPFWVLAPESMNGGPIRWLWTNGHYNDIQRQLEGESVGQEK